MKKSGKRLLCFALTALFVLGAVGCADKDSDVKGRDLHTNVKASLVDYSQNDEQVKIYGWRGPTDLSDVQWQYLKDSGINTLILDSTLDGNTSSQFGASNQEEYIKKCRDYGLKAIGFTGGVLNTNVKDYSGSAFYDTIAGVDYTDEPSLSRFEEIASVLDDFSAKYPGRTFFACLHSSYANAAHWGTPDYKEYLSSWYDIVLSQLPESMPRVLATDVYPFYEKTNSKAAYTDETWVRTLATMGNVKKAHPEVIMHMAMQSIRHGYGTQKRSPSEQDCLFQIYLNMAFGVTEFSWFTYSTPPVNIEFKDDDYAMIDRNGNRTDAYYAVQKANTVLNDLDEVFLSLDWQGVYPVQKDNSRDKNAFGYLNKFEDILVDADDMKTVKTWDAEHNAIVGMFTDENGNEGYLLVNYGDPTEKVSNVVTVECNDCNKLIVYRDGLPTVTDIEDGKVALSLKEGEGIYVIPYKE